MPGYGLIGYPLTHSFSKKYFTEKFLELKLKEHSYELFPLENIEQFEDLLQAHPRLSGLNVTIPYKQQVLQYLDITTAIPAAVNACNCIHIKEGKRIGYNTDIAGFRDSFKPLLRPHDKKALVLGNGGASAAVAYVLKELGLEYRIVSRNPAPGQLSYQELNGGIIAEHTVIINTTPLGTFPDVEACPAIPYEFITRQHYLFDLIYNPETTLFLQKGAANGAQIKNGYEMLVIQAEESWKIWKEDEH